jgi:hypothetical protein
MYKATRPSEYICFFQAEFPTRDDGDVYTYIFVDAYSKYVIFTGVEKDRSHKNVLKHIRLLTKNKDFRMHRGKPFTLVLHKFEEIKEDILQIIGPFNGKVIIDDPYVAEQVGPVLKDLMASMAGKAKPRHDLLN